jgi:phage-related protein
LNIGKLTYAGKNSLTDFGVYVTGSGTHNAAERDTTTFSIAGRNGDLVVDNGRYKNIQVIYPAFIPHTFVTEEQKVRNWLRTGAAYGKIADTYDTTHFRLGRPVGELTFTPVRPNGANFQITFDCDPRRFLVSGDSFTTITGGSWSAANPTEFDARPQIAVGDPENGMEIEITDGDGRVTTFTATDDHVGLVIIDCETQDIYDDSTLANLNSLFTISGEFPSLSAGTNLITLTGNYSAASVRPRWWEL